MKANSFHFEMDRGVGVRASATALLSYELNVFAEDPLDAVRHAGGWMCDRVRAGCLFAIYLMYAGTERFLVEFLRRNTRDSLGLTTAQLESLVMMLAGAIWIAIVVHRHGGIGRPSANQSRDTLQPAV